MIRPIITFIIPVLNGEKFIGLCLTSIKNQEFSDREYEVIVLDNGSTDSTLEIVHSLGFDCHVVPNLHVSGLRNYGVSKSKGEYLAFVDSDVELLPRWIENGMIVFQEETVVAAGCFPMIPSDSTWVQKTWDLHQRGRQSLISMKPVAWLPSMNLIVKRDIFLATKGFNENLRTAEDVDLCYRLGEYGKILCNPAMTAIHWGEAPDLQTFWRKEVWRGLGNVQGVCSHGFRWDELPSIGYPIYFVIIGLLFCLGIAVDWWSKQFLMIPISLFLLMIPPLLLAGYTSARTKKIWSLPHLFLLYLLYGLARAYAVVKSFII